MLRKGIPSRQEAMKKSRSQTSSRGIEHGHVGWAGILELQRSAGNAAVTSLVVQRAGNRDVAAPSAGTTGGPTVPSTLTLAGIGVMPVETEITLTFAQMVKTFDSQRGPLRRQELIPEDVTNGPLRVEVRKAAAGGLLRYWDDRIVGGKSGGSGDLEGVLVLNRSSRGRPRAALTIELSGLDLFQISFAGDMLRAAFHVGHLKVISTAGAPPPKSARRGTIAWDGGTKHPMLGSTDLGSEGRIRRYEVVLPPDPRIDRYIQQSKVLRQNLTIAPAGRPPVELFGALVEKVEFASAKGAPTVTIRLVAEDFRQGRS